MPRVENSCPFDPSTRAERCESCCERSGLPPCAVAWLRARVTPGNVTSLGEPAARSRAA